MRFARFAGASILLGLLLLTGNIGTAIIGAYEHYYGRPLLGFGLFGVSGLCLYVGVFLLYLNSDATRKQENLQLQNALAENRSDITQLLESARFRDDQIGQLLASVDQLNRENAALAEERKATRPYLSLKWREVSYQNENGLFEPVEFSDRTEIEIMCHHATACDIWLTPTKIGDIIIQGRVPIERLIEGASRLVEYTLIDGHNCINLDYHGYLRNLLVKMFDKVPTGQLLEVKMELTYTDLAGKSYRTKAALQFCPGLFDPPQFRIDQE